MKILIATIALNESEFIERNLLQHCDWPGIAGRIVVEGATETYAEANPDAVTDAGLSTDGTSEILEAWASEADRTYIAHGLSGGPLAQQKIALRNRYCEVADEINPDILVVIDADEFWCRRDQERVMEIVEAQPEFEAWLFRQRHLWRPQREAPDSPYSLELVGGYFNVPHLRVWRWEKGSRYVENHNHLSYPSIGSASLNVIRRFVRSDPVCVHLGFHRDPEHRMRTNRYYVARGEGSKDGRRWYVDCRDAALKLGPGDEMPHGMQAIPYSGPLPEVLQESS